jgi:hypothetical protein
MASTWVVGLLGLVCVQIFDQKLGGGVAGGGAVNMTYGTGWPTLSEKVSGNDNMIIILDTRMMIIIKLWWSNNKHSDWM